MESLYFPYWRFKGMFFSFGQNGIEQRFMDLSHQAIQCSQFPVSVGLRSQALKLKFVSPEIDGHFFQPTFNFDEAMEIFDQRFTTSVAKPILHQSHIGESLSLIYSPYYVDEKIYDGILNQALSGNLPETFDINQFSTESPNSKIRFVPTLCPSCGWDLEGQRDSLVLSCRNCHTMWRGKKNGLKQIRFAHIPQEGDDIIYLPFWRIKADVSGIELASYADLVRVANLPKAVQKGWDQMGFRFWALAFKIRPQTFLRLTGNLTLSQPRDQLETSLPAGKLYPVTLPVSESVESLKITLSSFMKPQKRILSTLNEIEIKPVSYMLVYIPFIEKHHDLVQPKYHVAVNKNQLKLSANL